jgi:hypothetical protein
MDEDALNVLLAEGVDLPTALAGSQLDSKRRASKWNRIGVLIGVLLVLAYVLLK